MSFLSSPQVVPVYRKDLNVDDDDDASLSFLSSANLSIIQQDPQSVISSSPSKYTDLFDNDYTERVLLIVPDDRYASSNSSFLKLLRNSDDMNDAALPEYDILEWKDKAIISGSFEPKDYSVLVKQISQKYLDYDGFVILDSIQTITYTASYLSFMFENLAKPIVITGSHSKSINHIFSDAKSNLLQALIIAGKTNICEVVVCFNKKIYRGNRIQREIVTSHDPFVSYNYPLLGSFQSTQLILTNHSMRHIVKKRFKGFTKLFENIIVIQLTPTLSDNILKTLLFTQLYTKNNQITNTCYNSPLLSPKTTILKKTTAFSLSTKVNKRSKSVPSIISGYRRSSGTNSMDVSINNLNNSNRKGIVISFYGVGNAPNRKSFRNILEEAINKYECEIVITNQPPKGGVDPDLYQSGNFFSKLALIYAHDMTIECCVAKLAYLMGKGLKGKLLKEEYETNLRGELTETIEKKRRIVKHIPMPMSVNSPPTIKMNISDNDNKNSYNDDDNGTDQSEELIEMSGTDDDDDNNTTDQVKDKDNIDNNNTNLVNDNDNANNNDDLIKDKADNDNVVVVKDKDNDNNVVDPGL